MALFSAAFLAGYLLKESASADPPGIQQGTPYNKAERMQDLMGYLKRVEGFRGNIYRDKTDTAQTAGYGTNLVLHEDIARQHLLPEQYSNILAGKEPISETAAAKIKMDIAEPMYQDIASQLPADKEYLVPGFLGANFQGATPKAITHAREGTFTGSLKELSHLGFQLPTENAQRVFNRQRDNLRWWYLNLHKHNPEAAKRVQQAYISLMKMPRPTTEEQKRQQINIYRNVHIGKQPGQK